MNFRMLGALAIAGALAGCGPKPASPGAPPPAATSDEQSYLAPPMVSAASNGPAGRVTLTGRAQPGSKVRLDVPSGAATLATADATGAWRATLPASSDLRLLALSMTKAGRTVKAEGYVALTPGGLAAQLRSGAGTLVLGAAPGGLQLQALDFDRQGATVISGSAHPGATVGLAIDGLQRQVGADSAGRFFLALNEPLPAGAHLVEAADGAARVRVTAPISPAAPLGAAPFRAERTPFGWRIDWTTPGGGVQSTILIAASEPST